MGFRLWGQGFAGLGFRAWGLGFRAWGYIEKSIDNSNNNNDNNGNACCVRGHFIIIWLVIKEAVIRGVGIGELRLRDWGFRA